MGEYRQLSDLPLNWSHGVTDSGRVFFIDELRHWTTWLHPITKQPFQSGFIRDRGLPTGWELDTDKDGAVFFIDHVNCVNTYQPPAPQALVANNGESNNESENKSAFQRTSSKKKFGFLKSSEKVPAVQRDYTSESVLKGWLYKQDEALLKLIKQWKKRWCVLSNGSLFCYEGDTEMQLVVSFNLLGCRITPRVKDGKSSYAYVFKVELQDDKKSYYFASDSDIDMDKWVQALSEAAGPAPEDVAQSHGVPHYPIQNYVDQPPAGGAAIPGNLNYPGENPVDWQPNDRFDYDGPYSTVGQAPVKPPRQIGQQQYVEPVTKYRADPLADGTAPQMRNNAANGSGQPRRSVYPYQQRGDNLVDDQQHVGDDQGRVLPYSAYVPDMNATSTPVRTPSWIDYPREPVAMSGNPEDLYAKVVKKNRPADRQMSNQGNSADTPNDLRLSYDRQAPGAISNPNVSLSAYPQDRRLAGRKPDEFTGRDYNFNVPGGRLETNDRDVGSVDPLYRSVNDPTRSSMDSRLRVYNGGERHLDGTPMFGDPRQDKRSPAAREMQRDDPQQTIPDPQQNLRRPNDQTQQQQLPDGSFFRYPSVRSGSQLHSSGAYDPHNPTGKSLTDERVQRGEEFFLPPRDYRGSQNLNANAASNVNNHLSEVPSNDLNFLDRFGDARSASRISNADSDRRLNVPNVESSNRLSTPNAAGSSDRLDVPNQFQVRSVSRASSRTADPTGNYQQPASLQSVKADFNGVRGHSQQEVMNGSLKSLISERGPTTVANGGTHHSFGRLNGVSPSGNRAPSSDYQSRQSAPARTQPAYQQTVQPSHGFEVIKEDPDMPDNEFQTSKTLDQLKKHLSGHVRLRLSISTGELDGKSHEELVLLLIQLRRSQTQLEEMRRWVQERLDSLHRSNSGAPQRQQGSNSTEPELSRMYSTELQEQYKELCKQIEITQPMINLLDNMVTMGSLYGANNLLYTSQYKKGQLPSSQPVPANKMLEFSRRHQEEQLATRQKQSQHQLTEVEADLEARQQRLYQLDRLLQERSFNVTSLQEDKAVLEKNLNDVCRLESSERDPGARSRLGQRRHVIEQELSRVRQQLAEASKLLEETTTENARVEQDVIMLRNKIYGLPHSTSSPSSANVNGTTQAVVRMEQELQQVKTMMQGLSTQGTALSETIQSFKPLSPGVKMPPPSSSRAGTFLETDLDRYVTRDIALRAQQSRPLDGSQRFKSSPDIVAPRDALNSTTRVVPPAADPSRSERRPENAHSSQNQPPSARYRPQGLESTTMSGGHYPPVQTASQPYLRSRPVEYPNSAKTQNATWEPNRWQETVVRSPVATRTYAPLDPTMNYYDPGNVRKSVRDVKSRNAAADRVVDDVGEPELRRTKSMPRVASDRSDRHYAGSQSRDKAEPSSAVQRLFQPYVSSGNIPAEMPLYTSNTKYRNGAPSGVPENRPAARSYGANSGSVERLSDDSGDRDQRGGFQRWRNMTVSSSHPAAQEARKYGWSNAPEKSRSFDNLVKSEQSQRMEFDDETIDRELQRPGQVLIPERYDLEDVENEQPLTEEERLLKLEKSEKYRKMLAAHSLQEFSEAELPMSGGPLRLQVDNEMKRREQLLDMRQQLAQEVTQKSKTAAMRRKSNPNIPEGFSAMIADRTARNPDQYTPDIIGYHPMSN